TASCEGDEDPPDSTAEVERPGGLEGRIEPCPDPGEQLAYVLLAGFEKASAARFRKIFLPILLQAQDTEIRVLRSPGFPVLVGPHVVFALLFHLLSRSPDSLSDPLQIPVW